MLFCRATPAGVRCVRFQCAARAAMVTGGPVPVPAPRHLRLLCVRAHAPILVFVLVFVSICRLSECAVLEGPAVTSDIMPSAPRPPFTPAYIFPSCRCSTTGTLAPSSKKAAHARMRIERGTERVCPIPTVCEHTLRTPTRPPYRWQLSRRRCAGAARLVLGDLRAAARRRLPHAGARTVVHRHCIRSTCIHCELCALCVLCGTAEVNTARCDAGARCGVMWRRQWGSCWGTRRA